MSAFDPTKVLYNYKGNRYSLLDASRKDPRRFNQLAMYLRKYINVSMSAIHGLIEGASDTVFIDRLRRRMKTNIHREGCCCSDQTQNMYDNSMERRAGVIKAHANKIPNLPAAPSILDIGTENIKYLDALEKVFGSNKVYGLNIDEGFNHYNDVTKFKDPRFRIYDGTNIPDDIQVDIITITAVLHHVPVANLAPLIKSIAKHAKYVIVKENDLTDKHISTFFMFQHYMFENMINQESLSYTNPDITRAQLDALFEDAGMKPIALDDTLNFTNNFWRVYGT